MSEHFDHDDMLDNAAAWVLGALPDDEAATFEALLATDREVQAEVARLQPVADQLGLAVPPATPPPSLKLNVMAIVEREAQLLAAAGPEADRPPQAAVEKRERRSILSRVFARPWLTATTVTAALAVGVAIGILASGGPSSVDHPVTGVQQWASVAGNVVEKSGSGELQLTAVPRLPDGQVYKVWLMRDGKPVGDRSFTPDPDGTASVNLRGDLDDATAVAISRETDPDVKSPTTTPIVTASLA